MKLMTRVRNDTCPHCNSERTIEGYDMKDRPIRFTLYMDNGNTDRLKDKSLSHFKCRRCGSIFNIDWTDPDNPRPLSDIKMSDFIRKYNNTNEL